MLVRVRLWSLCNRTEIDVEHKLLEYFSSHEIYLKHIEPFTVSATASNNIPSRNNKTNNHKWLTAIKKSINNNNSINKSIIANSSYYSSKEDLLFFIGFAGVYAGSTGEPGATG